MRIDGNFETAKVNTTSDKSRRQKKKIIIEPGRSIFATTKDNEDTSDSEVEPELDDIESDGDIQSNESDEAVEYYSPTTENLINGKFLLVKFLSENQVEIQGLKSVDSRKVFKIVENDVSAVPFCDIVAVLPDSTIQEASQEVSLRV
ncbi:hypothetical protein FQR65_LT00988 [Abscondita terminalis]|nr:hypothetical protein FQR65_LT00988 [Abscondita terminalis]